MEHCAQVGGGGDGGGGGGDRVGGGPSQVLAHGDLHRRHVPDTARPRLWPLGAGVDGDVSVAELAVELARAPVVPLHLEQHLIVPPLPREPLRLAAQPLRQPAPPPVRADGEGGEERPLGHVRLERVLPAQPIFVQRRRREATHLDRTARDDVAVGVLSDPQCAAAAPAAADALPQVAGEGRGQDRPLSPPVRQQNGLGAQLCHRLGESGRLPALDAAGLRRRITGEPAQPSRRRQRGGGGGGDG
mmetsp:Transcript_18874/g.61557  ORF Transcript_18874/g.61557 Transcript_18874/m.61557 type:complete len:245 (-) Transcript_18874:12-746(-)